MDDHDVVLYRRDVVFAPGTPPVDAHETSLEGSYEAHSHEFVELVLICGGEGLHRTLHGTTAFRQGDLFVLRPGAWHAYRECTALRVYNCCFGVELLDRELGWLQEDPGLNYLCWTGPLAPERRGVLSAHLRPAAQADCRARLDALRHVVRGCRPAGRVEIVALLMLVLTAVAGEVQGAAGPGALSRIHPAVTRGMRLLDADPARQWTLADLAGAVHLHPSYLVRLFGAQVGLSPMAYLAQRRAERAATLLLHSNRAVNEIGRAVGWAEPSYFTRRFRACFGVSPSRYRTRHAGAAQVDRTHMHAPPS